MNLAVWQWTVAALTLVGLMANSGLGEGEPIFRLDFSAFADRAGNDLKMEVGPAVSLGRARQLITEIAKLAAGR